MNNLDQQYIDILTEIYDSGAWIENRTGVRSKEIPSATIQHNMAEGFPLLTIKKVPFKSMAVELEGFIKGVSSKKWYQERGCTIWNEWCNPKKVSYGHDELTKQKMLEEDDLGLIYGNNWRDFHCPDAVVMPDGEMVRSRGIDQFKNIVKMLKSNPNDRRMLCLAWNPLAMDYAALPACHVLWKVSVIANKLHLTWFQRSCDFPLGIPYNLASYGLLLHLLAKESGLGEGILTGFLSNVHFYENQLTGVETLLKRDSDFDLPRIDTPKFQSIFDWEYKDTKITTPYNCLPTIKMPVAV